MRRLTLLLVGAVIVVAACGDEQQEVSYTATRMGSDEQVSIRALRGRPAILVSWATWCNECDKELADLQAFVDSPGAAGLQIVAVNLDAADVGDEIDAKVQRHHLSMELWRDRRNGFKRAFSALGVPTTVVIDRDGGVVGTFPGAVDFDDKEVLAALDRARGSS